MGDPIVAEIHGEVGALAGGRPDAGPTMMTASWFEVLWPEHDLCGSRPSCSWPSGRLIGSSDLTAACVGG